MVVDCVKWNRQYYASSPYLRGNNNWFHGLYDMRELKPLEEVGDWETTLSAFAVTELSA